ncbi:DnaJ domain-containing protein [Hirsutella rhossiliensis]|uniref:DnaJ domain-containing protein n=1 Tax=Hirsutella rhossiliensis TaxID=111463 RepID=A0A9P8MVM0_9HYPO|nr:dnaJ domain-containing protein [Hirsutella rhossiliensis]KAH0962923.1 dnaJ domain-containing protein [Hirsutella rhossiliensis]
MSEDNKDLVRFASEYAEQDVDLYQLLGVDALTSKEDIHRTWRKRSLKYHPDKAGDQFDASKWELFERARDVLSDPDARAVYDQATKAKLLRKHEREAMDRERRHFADDLEAREQAAMRQRQDKEHLDRETLQKERERLAEDVADLAEARRRLKEKRDEKARRKQAKVSIKASLGGGGKRSGPANGTIDVPGNYLVGLGDVNKKYWELVCDKLRAVQAVRNLRKQAAAPEELQEATQAEQEARRRIHEAEANYQREAAAL